MKELKATIAVALCESDVNDDEENGPVLESNEEDSEYDELQLKDNDSIDFGKEVQLVRNTARR